MSLDESEAVMSWPADLRSAYVEAWAEMTAPTKSATADAGTYSYSYAALSSVDAVLRPVLARHDLAYTCDVVVVEQCVLVSHSLLHASGVGRTSWLSIEFGRGAQALGSAVTYLRRYQLLALFGLAPSDDDDGRAAVARVVEPSRRADVDAIAALLSLLDVPADDKRSTVEYELGRSISAADDLSTLEAAHVIARLSERLQRSQGGDSTDVDSRSVDEHTATSASSS